MSPPLLCALLLSLFPLLLGGCEKRLFWAYRDDPYLTEYAEKGEAFWMSKLTSPYPDSRQLALRVLAELAAKARLQGDSERSERLIEILLERFRHERSDEVRTCILAICLPRCGAGSATVLRFLREQIAEGRWAGSAAITLATLEGSSAFSLLAPLAKHPHFEVRYDAALALILCGDPQAAPLVQEILTSMRTPPWPAKIRGVSFEEARKNLLARAKQAWPRFPFEGNATGLPVPPLP